MSEPVAKHTAGPWLVGALDSNDQRVVCGDIEICTCWHHGVASIEREMEANARLIAAAPDLLSSLEALEVVVSQTIGAGAVECGDDPCLIALFNARAAIAKATNPEAK